jgi:hypothetical protein
MRLRSLAVALPVAVVLATGLIAMPASADRPDQAPVEAAATPAAFPAINGTYVPIAGYFDCDSGSDEPAGQHNREEPGVLLYGPGPAADYLWTDLVVSGGTLSKTQSALSVGGTYVPLVGDFDRDRCDDILWYGAGAAPDVLWWGGPTGFTRGVNVSVNGTYRPVVFARSSILWYAPNGTESVWEGTGNRSAPFRNRAIAQVAGSSYQPVPFFDGWNGLAQVLWYTPGSGPDSIWAINTVAGGYRVEKRLPVTISGVYRTTSWGSGVVLHGPGAAADQFMSTVFSAQVNYYPLSIAGSYRVSGSGRVLVWHGPGSAPDQVWLNPGQA